jgi:hypothetical protein
MDNEQQQNIKAVLTQRMYEYMSIKGGPEHNPDKAMACQVFGEIMNDIDEPEDFLNEMESLFVEFGLMPTRQERYLRHIQSMSDTNIPHTNNGKPIW